MTVLPGIEKKLATRISGWLRAQSDRKLGPMFCEAVIALPIAECLNESLEKGFKLEPEYHWGVRQKCDVLKDIYFDLAGCAESSVSFIIETKYLKKKVEAVRSEILIDLFRLSLPISKRLQRYFVVVGPEDLFPNGGDEDGFKRAIFRESNIGTTIDLDKKFIDFQTRCKSNKFANSQRWNGGAKIPAIDMVLRAQEKAVCLGGDYNIMIWSIDVRPA